MAPIRRYLRITKYSAIECRIYLENPALAQSWLLNPRHNVLPRVIKSVRPLVLPKLQEERERARKKTGAAKKKSINDVVVEDDFEVSVYLIETPIRHSLLVKHKQFRDKRQTKLKSNSSKLLGGDDKDTAIDVDDVQQGEESVPVLRVEDSDDDAMILGSIPMAPTTTATEAESQQRRPKRRRAATIRDSEDEDESDQDMQPQVIDSDEEYSGGEEETQPPTKSLEGTNMDEPEDGDRKKKLSMDISYEGFSIYGRVLCLVVKKKETTAAAAKGKGKAADRCSLVDNWISSTQIPVVGD